MGNAHPSFEQEREGNQLEGDGKLPGESVHEH